MYDTQIQVVDSDTLFIPGGAASYLIDHNNLSQLCLYKIYTKVNALARPMF